MAPTLQQQSSRISPKTAIDALGQRDKKILSEYFPPAKIFRDYQKRQIRTSEKAFSALQPIKTYLRNNWTSST
jgi:hypothetical protein